MTVSFSFARYISPCRFRLFLVFLFAENACMFSYGCMCDLLLFPCVCYMDIIKLRSRGLSSDSPNFLWDPCSPYFLFRLETNLAQFSICWKDAERDQSRPFFCSPYFKDSGSEINLAQFFVLLILRIQSDMGLPHCLILFSYVIGIQSETALASFFLKDLI